MSPEVHVFEFFREVGIGLGVAAPIVVTAFVFLRIYVKGEINELRASIRQEMDATTIEIRNEYVTLSEFGRQLSAHDARFVSLGEQLAEIRGMILTLLSRGGNHP